MRLDSTISGTRTSTPHYAEALTSLAKELQELNILLSNDNTTVRYSYCVTNGPAGNTDIGTVSLPNLSPI